MKTNYTYRMYGRSKGRGKNNEISNDAISIKIKKIDPLKYNIIDIGAGYGESTLAISKTHKVNRLLHVKNLLME